MNAMDLLTGPLAQSIGWALLHLLWQATIVAAILAAVLALLPRQSASARYAAACGALAAVFVMFVATAIRAYDPAAAPIAAAPVAETTAGVPLTKVPVVIAATAIASWRDQAMDAVATARQSLPSIVAIWVLGVVFLSVRLLVSWVRARRLVRRGTTAAGAEWQRMAARLSAALGLRRAVRLLESAAVEVPSVLGSMRPVILIPASMLTGLTPQQIEMVLAHELAHIRRHDFLINLLQAFVETLMFYHPAVWWMSRRVRIERENCCDDLAVAVCGSRLEYARALTRLEEMRATALPVVVAASGGSLLERIRRIAAGRAEAASASSRWAAAVAMLSIVAIGLTLPSLPLFADREQPAHASSTVEVVDQSIDVDVDSDAETDVDVDLDVDLDALADHEIDVDLDVDVDHADFDHADFVHEAWHVAPPAIPAAPARPLAPAIAPVPDVPPPGFVAPPPAMAPAPPMPVGSPMPPIAPNAPTMMAALMDLDEPRDREIGSRKLTVDELIQLRAVGVTPEYIEAMRAIFPTVTVRGVTGLRAVGVTPEFIREMRAAGIEVASARDAQGLKALEVTPTFVREMRETGFEVRSAHDAQSLKAVGVTPAYVREMRDAGFDIRSARDAQGLKAVGVTPEYVREMRAAGFDVGSARDAQGLKAVGVTPEYVREMRAAGFDVRSARDAQSLKAVGVTPAYVREMRAAGVEIATARDATSLKAVGVTPQFVKKLADAGYSDLSARELTRLAAVGIDDDFIREMSRYRNKK